jgi:hypothetical protein
MGIAIHNRWWDPREWKFGKSDALEDDGRVSGVWWHFGPLAIFFD